MFRYGGKDVVAGRPGSIGVPEGEKPPFRISLIPHLTDNEAGIVDIVECLSSPTQGVGLPTLHVEVQELEGLYLVKDKVKARHGENRRSHLDLLLLSASSPSSLPSPHSSSDESESSSDSDGESSSSPLPSKYKDTHIPPPPPSLRSFTVTRFSSSYEPPPFLLWSPIPLECIRAQVLRSQMEVGSGFLRRL